jgi:hypothetical protein
VDVSDQDRGRGDEGVGMHTGPPAVELELQGPL